MGNPRNPNAAFNFNKQKMRERGNPRKNKPPHFGPQFKAATLSEAMEQFLHQSGKEALINAPMLEKMLATFRDSPALKEELGRAKQQANFGRPQGVRIISEVVARESGLPANRANVFASWIYGLRELPGFTEQLEARR